jgi:4-amino-4-deoxy-L-arabinose transferase-like glycosyltransferase
MDNNDVGINTRFMNSYTLLVILLYTTTILFLGVLLFLLKFNVLSQVQWSFIKEVLPMILILVTSFFIIIVAYTLYKPYFNKLLSQGNLWLMMIFLLGVVLRLAYIIAIPTQPVSDFDFYNTAAINLLKYGVYGTSIEPVATTFPPGTSLFLASIYFITGSTNIIYPKLFQVFLGALDVVLVYFIARSVFNESIAKISSLLFALLPSHIAFTSVLASENPFTTLNLIILYLILQPKFRSNNYHFLTVFIIGVSSGLSLLCRPVGILLPFFVIISLILKNFGEYHSNIKRASIIAVICLLGFTLIVMPWGLRNYEDFSHFSITSSSGGINFWMGNNEQATGKYMFNELISKNVEDASGSNPFNEDQIFYKKGIDYVVSHPLQTFMISVKKIIILYSGDNEAIYWSMTGDGVINNPEVQNLILNLINLIVTIFDYYFYMILGLSLLSIPFLIKEIFNQKNFGITILLGYVICYTVIYSVNISGQRFHFNIIPILIILSGYTISLLHRFRDEPLFSGKI